MTASVTFETATIADAVGKAARIAPSKGVAFDKSAGIVLEIEPGSGIVVLRASNLEVTYREEVRALEVGDEAARWRLPSELFADVLAGLPIGSGASTSLTADPKSGWIHLKSGRRRSRFSQIHGDFPEFPKFDDTGLEAVPDFAMRVKQAAWAADKAQPPWSGVHIDGETITATDRYRLVRVPCAVPIEQPITVPMTILTPILRDTMMTRLKAEERRLLLMPDEYTQITSAIFDATYPTKERLEGVARKDFMAQIELDRQEFLDTLSAMLVMVKSERYPRMHMDFHAGELQLFMQVPDKGEIEDTIEVAYSGEDFHIEVTPQYLTHALNASSRPKVTMKFGPLPTQNLGISDSDDYHAWIMPRQPGDDEEN